MCVLFWCVHQWSRGLPARKNWAPDDELGLFRGRSRLPTPVAHVLFLRQTPKQNYFSLRYNLKLHSLAKQFIIALKPIFTDPLSGASAFLGEDFRQNAENKNWKWVFSHNILFFQIVKFREKKLNFFAAFGLWFWFCSILKTRLFSLSPFNAKSLLGC